MSLERVIFDRPEVGRFFPVRQNKDGEDLSCLDYDGLVKMVDPSRIPPPPMKV